MTKPSSELFLLIGAASGLLAVALGAFGAHALESHLDARSRSIYDTAVQYHFFHTFALIAVALVQRGADHARLRIAGWAFSIGLLVFCGSLYVLSVTGLRWLGAVTPFGGLAFMLGWIMLFAGTLATRR